MNEEALEQDVGLSGKEGGVGEGDKVGASQQSPLAFPCSTNERCGDEEQPESGRLTSLI